MIMTVIHETMCRGFISGIGIQMWCDRDADHAAQPIRMAMKSNARAIPEAGKVSESSLLARLCFCRRERLIQMEAAMHQTARNKGIKDPIT